MSASATARLLDEAGGLRAMTWVMGIMMFLTVLAAAAGLATGNAAVRLDSQLAGRLTVQLPADPPRARALAATLAALPGVTSARAVPPQELQRLLAPWLGAEAADAALPIPALIDVDVAGEAPVSGIVAAARRVSGSARVDRHAAWMSPVSGVMTAVTWLAAGLVLLMASATAAVVVLAARAGLEAHRATIEVMHMLGSTDVQIARLFQRRLARDAALGGIGGAAAAAVVILFLGGRIAQLQSELLGGAALGSGGWLALLLLPAGFVALAAVAARVAVIRALGRIL